MKRTLSWSPIQVPGQFDHATRNIETGANLYPEYFSYTAQVGCHHDGGWIGRTASLLGFGTKLRESISRDFGVVRITSSAYARVLSWRVHDQQ